MQTETKLIDILNQLIYEDPFYKSEIPFIQNKDNWYQYTRREFHYSEFLDSFTGSYFSPLNPVLLFQLNKGCPWEKLSVISAMDGLLSLLRFFNKYPTPPKNFPLLLIHKDLAPIVPEEWIGCTGTYRLVVTKRLMKKEIENVLVFNLAEPEQSSISYIERQLRTISKNLDSVNVYTSTKHDFNFLIHQKYQEEKFLYYFSILQLYKELFKDKRKESDTNHIIHGVSSNSVYLNVNPHKFYFSDSYIDHELLSSGIAPINMDEFIAKDSKAIIELSPYHGMEVEDIAPHSFSAIKEDIDSLKNGFYRDFLMREDEIIHEDSHYLFSDTFFDYARSVQEIFNQNAQ